MLEYAPHSIRTASPPFCIMDSSGKIVETFTSLLPAMQPLLTTPGHTICIKYDITWFAVPKEFGTIQNRTKRIIFNVNTEEIRIVSKFKSSPIESSESFVYRKEDETETDDVIPANILKLAKEYILQISPAQLKRLSIWDGK